MNVLIDGVGSPIWGTLKPFLEIVADKIIGIDITPYSCGLYLFNKGYLVPPYSQKDCFDYILDILKKENIDIVLPIVHEGLPLWANRMALLKKLGIFVFLSPISTIDICNDKWKTFEFFRKNKIKTPATSLKHEFCFLKPRFGRGGAGIRHIPLGESVNMEGYISQQFIEGQEYSVDVFCDIEGNALCIVPRKRVQITSGISTVGQVVKDIEIESQVKQILSFMKFLGPINIQCFKNSFGIYFIEINSRLAGGMSLSMHATCNWFKTIYKIIKKEQVHSMNVNYGLIMMRYFSEIVISEENLCVK